MCVLMGGLMPKGMVTMSTKEIDRGELIRRVREKRLTQAKAAALLGLSPAASEGTTSTSITGHQGPTR
jgi:hypothetical protein